jgi:hypothetical protein
LLTPHAMLPPIKNAIPNIFFGETCLIGDQGWT